jgi:hypothetical protein
VGEFMSDRRRGPEKCEESPKRPVGRPLAEDKARSAMIVIKVTEAMKKEMRSAAKRSGFKTLSDYVRHLHEQFAREVER